MEEKQPPQKNPHHSPIEPRGDELPTRVCCRIRNRTFCLSAMFVHLRDHHTPAELEGVSLPSSFRLCDDRHLREQSQYNPCDRIILNQGKKEKPVCRYCKSARDSPSASPAPPQINDPIGASGSSPQVVNLLSSSSSSDSDVQEMTVVADLLRSSTSDSNVQEL